MATITLRQANVVTSTGGTVKGAPLTNGEVDNNFANLNVSVNNLTSNIGGLFGNLSSSSGVASLVGDETGSGSLVFAISPSLSGTPQAPTAAATTNNTMLATTAFVAGELSSANAYVNGELSSANAYVNTRLLTKANVSDNLSVFATTTSADLAGIISDETGNGVLVFNTSPTINTPIINTPTINRGLLKKVTLDAALERANVRAEVTPANVTYDLAEQTILYYTSNSTANTTINFRANSTITLNDYLDNNSNAITAVLLMTNGATGFYPTVVQIDGTTIHSSSIKGNLFWQGNSLTAGGTTAAIDSYGFTIIKRATNTFTVLASQTQYKSFLA